MLALPIAAKRFMLIAQNQILHRDMKGECGKLRTEPSAETFQLQTSSSTIGASCRSPTLDSPDRTTSHHRGLVGAVVKLDETIRPWS